jgi:hypothetical protein
MRAVCIVRGFTLLLRVGTLWRCSDGLFFEVPPLASDALLKTLHPLLGKVNGVIRRVHELSKQPSYHDSSSSYAALLVKWFCSQEKFRS